MLCGALGASFPPKTAGTSAACGRRIRQMCLPVDDNGSDGRDDDFPSPRPPRYRGAAFGRPRSVQAGVEIRASCRSCRRLSSNNATIAPFMARNMSHWVSQTSPCRARYSSA